VLDIADVQVGQSYMREDVPDRVVTVTRIWTDETGTGVAYDIADGAHRKNPYRAKTATWIELFAALHSPIPGV
jgi:hypothetical protein